MVATVLVSGKLFLANQPWFGGVVLLIGFGGAVSILDRTQVKVFECKDLEDMLAEAEVKKQGACAVSDKDLQELMKKVQTEARKKRETSK